MGLSLYEVRKNFENQKVNRTYGDVIWDSSAKIFRAEGRLLKSGSDLLAIFLAPGLVLKNGDRGVGEHNGGWRSGGSSYDHKQDARRLPGPTISFTALRGAGIDPTLLKADNVLDWTKPEITHLVQDPETGEFFDSRGNWDYPFESERAWTPPGVGQWEKTGQREKDGVVFHDGRWHVIESVLFSYEGKRYLAAVDENQYFISRLADTVEETVGSMVWKESAQNINTVQKAFDYLKPFSVIRAEKEGVEVKRQGEWFFIKRFADDGQLLSWASHTYSPDGQTLSEVAKSVFMPHLLDSRREPIFTGYPLIHPKRDLVKGDNDAEIVFGSGNRHIASRSLLWTPGVSLRKTTAARGQGEKMLVSGNVVHTNWSGVRTYEHRDLFLGEGWWEAIPNTEEMSWSFGGKVD